LNIVFDLGGVVFNWQPEAIVRSTFEDTNTRDLVRREIFEHADWVELDRGTLALEQAIDRGAARTGLSLQDIQRLLNAVPPFLTPIEATIELIRELSNTTNKLFVLSNMHLASIAYLEKRHNIWDLFDGVVISSRIQMIKPEPQIYEHLLERYQLAPAETIFIDDTEMNLAAAAAKGIQTIRFFNTGQCEQALARSGCLVR
jgi:putative hydrolase of the HAD superfamily